MTRTALVLLLLAYLPGALILRVPLLDRARRAGLPAEERLFWAVVLSAALSSVAALILAVIGSYALERLLWLNGAVCLGVGLTWRSRLRLGAGAPRPTPTAAAPLALGALAAVVFFFVPPAEYVNGGRDPAVYFNSGIRIAQEGSYRIDDPLVRAVPPAYRELFFQQVPPAEPFESVRFLGFFATDQDAGTVVGQFPPLYPVWIAIAYDTLGLTGARYVHGLWALLGVLSVYFAGASALGRRAAFAGAALLALHVAQVWFARYFCAEMIAQPLVFAGVLAYARAHVDGDRFFAPLAGVLLGLTLFAHILGVVVIAAAGLAVLVGRADGQPLLASFVTPLVVLGTLAAAFSHYAPVPSHHQLYWFASTRTPVDIVLGGGTALAAATLFVALGRAPVAAMTRRWLPRLLAAALWLLAAYALLVREGGDRDPAIEPYWLHLYTGFYLLPIGLAAALVGWLLATGSRFWRGSALFVVAASFTVFIFYNARITPDHFWTARRYVLIVLPVCLLLIGAAAFTPAARLDRLRLPGIGRFAVGHVRAAVGAALVAGLGWAYWQATLPILRHTEHAGMIPWVETLAERLGPDDLLLMGPRSTTDAQVAALPLAYVYNRNVLVLTQHEPDLEVLADFLNWARTLYSRVLFLGGGGTDLLSRSTAVRLVASDRHVIRHYERALNAYPNGVVDWQLDYGIYEFLPEDAGNGGAFTVDVGAGNDLYVHGMYPKDTDPRGVTYRWTRDTAFVRVIGTRADAATVTLRLSNGGRPPAAGTPIVRVFLDGRPLGAVTVATDRFESYDLAIPPELAQRVAARQTATELRLETDAWVPQEVLGIPDPRALGVMLDHVEVH